MASKTKPLNAWIEEKNGKFMLMFRIQVLNIDHTSCIDSTEKYTGFLSTRLAFLERNRNKINCAPRL